MFHLTDPWEKLSGKIDGNYIINPTVSELQDSDIDMVVGGTRDSVLMIEGEMDEITETEMLEAIKAAHASIAKLYDKMNYAMN